MGVSFSKYIYRGIKVLVGNGGHIFLEASPHVQNCIRYGRVGIVKCVSTCLVTPST